MQIVKWGGALDSNFTSNKWHHKLRRLQNRDKYRRIGIIVITIFVVFISIIYFTYSKFTSSGRFTIVDTTVQEFSQSDYYIAAYIDGVYSDTIPTKEEAYANNLVGDKVECNNDAIGTWDNERWGIYIDKATKKTKCSVYFKKFDLTPSLFQGLIPVKYDNLGNVIIAEKNNNAKDWFNYNDHKWANAVLVNCEDSSIKDKYFNSDMSIKASAGTQIPMDEILQMYVWIPRYKYKLFNANEGTSNPQMIDIVFENSTTPKSTVIENGKYYTHPAFTFGDTELEGIWVGKFETSGTTAQPTIKPNLISLTNINVATMFNTVKVAQNPKYGVNNLTTDVHMMKNMEWGAVAYLTNSRYGRYIDENNCIESGCEVWINNVNTNSPHGGSSITGCSANSVNAGTAYGMSTCASGYSWHELGVNASTTGNIYGIYDMSGGTWEYVMGVMKDSSGTSIQVSNFSGFSAATLLEEKNKKYYDLYDYQHDDSGSAASYKRYHIGDATKEVISTIAHGGYAWNGDSSYTIYDPFPWIYRGGNYYFGSGAGLFQFGADNGNSYNGCNSFRSVLTAS